MFWIKYILKAYFKFGTLVIALILIFIFPTACKQNYVGDNVNTDEISTGIYILYKDKSPEKYNYIVQVPPIIVIMILYFIAFRENTIINIAIITTAAIMTVLMTFLERKVTSNETTSNSYKKSYSVSYLLFSIVILICIFLLLLVKCINHGFFNEILKNVSISLILLGMFIYLIKYIIFSIIPTILDLRKITRK